MSDFHAAQLRREQFRALAAEHRVAAMRGRLIEAAVMHQAAALIAELAREILAQWVADARHQEGTDTDTAEIWLRRTGREALSTICERLQRQIAATRKARGAA